MNNEKKFRAWDGKAMSESFNLDDASYEGFPRPVTDDNGECRSGAHITWLQWTGECDVNGKEIFEGDLVQWSRGVGEVYFDMGSFRVRDFYLPYQDSPDDAFGERASKKIIGNIYQNPESIKNHV